MENGPIKNSRTGKPTPLASVQTNPADGTQAEISPLDFYNLHSRQEGEKVLTQKEFDLRQKRINADLASKGNRGNTIYGTKKD